MLYYIKKNSIKLKTKSGKAMIDKIKLKNLKTLKYHSLSKVTLSQAFQGLFFRL